MTVVCEGAETSAERSLLKAVGADVLQGFVDGQPMEMLDALELVGRDKRKSLRLVSI
jgi:EAL domain-containing protein (putative c-di-GMP-specific phosphodiesterase class I)